MIGRAITRSQLIDCLRAMLSEPLPLPGRGETAQRHRRLMQIARKDLSLARLAEAHWDAVAILTEAGHTPVPGAVYGVWAAEIPGSDLRLEPAGNGYMLQGTKCFCSGVGLIDRALVTVGKHLVEVDLWPEKRNGGAVRFDTSGWVTNAFALTNTGTAIFQCVPVAKEGLVGEPGFYLERPGFWHGACGPAACWAGGAAALVDWAMEQRRNDSHTLAHLGGMRAELWSLETVLDAAGREIDAAPDDGEAAHLRSLTVRHLVEQACTQILRRTARAFGPHPLAFVGPVSQTYQELDLYLRQHHAERDLEALGHLVRSARAIP